MGKAKICSECRSGYLAPSVTLLYWHKCPICAFTVLDLELLHPWVRENAQLNPLTLNPHAPHTKPSPVFDRLNDLTYRNRLP